MRNQDIPNFNPCINKLDILPSVHPRNARLTYPPMYVCLFICWAVEITAQP